MFPFIGFILLPFCPYIGRGGNRAGRAGLGRANSGPGQNRAGPKLARFFRANILTAQPALKTGPVGPNCLFKAKKIRAGRAGPGHTRLGYTGPGQIWPGFFRAKNLMAQPGPNFGRTGPAHRAGPILPPLYIGIYTYLNSLNNYTRLFHNNPYVLMQRTFYLNVLTFFSFFWFFFFFGSVEIL